MLVFPQKSPAEAKTIESQLAEVRARITADGFEQSSVLEFVDDGYRYFVDTGFCASI